MPSPLSSRFPLPVLLESLREPATWSPYPPITDRARWEAIDPVRRQVVIQAGERRLSEPWPTITAVSYLTFARTGDRLTQEKLHFPRRHALKDLVLAECVEQRGRFLDAVIDGIWSTCEESYWGWTSHLALQQAGAVLPDVEEPTVDLGVGDTAGLLSWVHHVMGPALDGVSMLVRRRIEVEVQRRVLEPLRYRTDWWWMGLNHSDRINNWAPWICSNWLTSLLLVEPNPRLRAQGVAKALRVLDRFLESYDEDGGCDEGPRYWVRAAAALADGLRLLRHASAGRINGFELPVVRAMAAFLHQMRVVDHDYVNFGDTEAYLPRLDSLVAYRYGADVGDQRLMALGQWLHRHPARHAPPGLLGPLCMEHHLAAMFHDWNDAPASSAAPPPAPERDIWIPSIQTMIARDQPGESSGFCVAAKGSHNGQSHNHNDVGQVLVWLDGRPLLVDAGVGVYTLATFNHLRYTLWTMQSAWHNLPTINGLMQQAGVGFAARDVSYHADDAAAELAMDLAAAYPPEARVRTWRRTIRLQRGKGVTVSDRFELVGENHTLAWSLLTPSTVAVVNPTTLQLTGVLLPGDRHSADATIRLQSAAVQGKLAVRVEEQPLNDAVLETSWPSRLLRVWMEATAAPPTGELVMEITR